jgi:mono/diheme cytochrome c family protein
MTRTGRVFVAVVAVAVAAAAAVAVIALHRPEPVVSAALAQRKADPHKGAYLATAGDCVACHTAPGGKSFAGGLPFATPVGTVFSTNITADRDNGIGNYTLQDFIRLMRFGVARDGRRVYPAMPYTAYARVSDEDLQDLLAYLQQLPPINAVNRPIEAAWPLSMRWPLALWNVAFHDDTPFQPDPNKSAVWNRGAYLVQGLGHCGTCHTPRGLALQEKDLTGRSNEFLSGGVLAGFSSTNLRGNNGSGLGSWTEQDIVDLLKTGRSTFSAVHGPMTEVVQDSTQYIGDADLKAIAVYLKSLSPAPSDAQPGFEKSDATIQAFMDGSENAPGGRIFMDSCSACHRLDGSGAGRGFPRLAGNASVLNPNADSLIAIILQGNRLPSTEGAPSGLAMPAFGWRYNDADIAALATFVRTSWGNRAAAVGEEDVRRVRAQLAADQSARRAASARD